MNEDHNDGINGLIRNRNQDPHNSIDQQRQIAVSRYEFAQKKGVDRPFLKDHKAAEYGLFTVSLTP